MLTLIIENLLRLVKLGTNHGFNYNIDYVIPNRYGVNTTRHSVLEEVAKLIPFSFTIKLPPPQYKRAIVARNKRTGQIIRSVPV